MSHPKIIINKWLKSKKINLDENSNIFENEKMDSFFFIEFLIFCEKKFHFNFNKEKLYNKQKLSLKEIYKIILKNAKK